MGWGGREERERAWGIGRRSGKATFSSGRSRNFWPRESGHRRPLYREVYSPHKGPLTGICPRLTELRWWNRLQGHLDAHSPGGDLARAGGRRSPTLEGAEGARAGFGAAPPLGSPAGWPRGPWGAPGGQISSARKGAPGAKSGVLVAPGRSLGSRRARCPDAHSLLHAPRGALPAPQRSRTPHASQ